MSDGLMMNSAMAVWPLVGLAALVLLVLGVVWLVHQLWSLEGRTPTAEIAATAELAVRYARGEIDRETYLLMRDDLSPR